MNVSVCTCVRVCLYGHVQDNMSCYVLYRYCSITVDTKALITIIDTFKWCVKFWLISLFFIFWLFPFMSMRSLFNILSSFVSHSVSLRSVKIWMSQDGLCILVIGLWTRYSWYPSSSYMVKKTIRNKQTINRSTSTPIREDQTRL